MKVVKVEDFCAEDRIGNVVKKFLAENDVKAIEVGKYPLENGALVNVLEYETKESYKFEAHKRFIDVQMLVEGEENIFYAPLSAGEPTVEYNDVKDVQFYSCKEYETLYIQPFEAAILYPEDLHAPNNAVGAPRKNKKLVFKIPVEE